MINLSIEPNNTQFSIKNAHALALASWLAYKSEDAIRNKLQEQDLTANLLTSPAPIPNSLLPITAQL
jgi:triacylglycerol lipase